MIKKDSDIRKRGIYMRVKMNVAIFVKKYGDERRRNVEYTHI